MRCSEAASGDLMIIEEREYSRGELRQYLIENSDSIFEEDQIKRKRWLKIYCILVGDNNWKNTLFSPEEITTLGEVYKVSLQAEGSREDEDVYYIEEYCPGLLLMFTTASNQEYKEQLGNRISRSRGVSRMWLKPNLYRIFWKGILEETGGYIYRFSGRRGAFDDTPCKVRPNYKRRIGYTGDDGTQSLEEFEEMYGVTPYMVYMRVAQDLKIHLTNEGLYSAQEASTIAINLFYKYLDKVKDEVLELMRTSQSFKFDIVSEDANLKFASIDAGIIQLDKQEMEPATANSMIEELENFSFIDVNIETGSLGMSATVIDEIKGSVFDINVSESNILIVPKYKVTFESFIDFYKGIVESIDENARISLVNYSR